MIAEPVRTTCPLDCPDTCALHVRVDGDGRVALAGDPAHPVTAGFICSKVARFGRRLDHPERLLTPARRSGPKGSGRFTPISWDEAIAEITERLREVIRDHGGEAILPFHYGGSNGLLSEDFLDALYFARLGASRLAKTICAAPSTVAARAMYGRMMGVDYEDYPAARMIVVWGANPRVSQIHLVPFLKRAREQGAVLAVVDPVRTFASDQVDLHLAPLPGSDLPLALGLVRRFEDTGALDRGFLARHAKNLEPLLEAARPWTLDRAAREADVPERDLARLADLYAESSPAVIRTGWGMERNVNGTRALAAVLALPALLGKLGVPGGGYTMSNGDATKVDKPAVLGYPEGIPWPERTVNMSQLGRWLTPGSPADPPVKALFVYNANPAVTVPDQRAVLAGLSRGDLFTVVFDQVMTDTARYADLVLPATTFLEQWEIKTGYGNTTAGGIQPVVPRRGEARPNVEVFAALGRAMGFADPAFSWDEETCFRRVAEALELHGRPADGEALSRGESLAVSFPGGRPVQMVNVQPPTPDGKIDLAPAVLGPEPYRYQPVRERDPSQPLFLISPAHPKLLTTMFGESSLPELAVTLHPSDAAARGIQPGDRVRVHNSLGEVLCTAAVSDRLRPGVATIPKGAWQRSSANGETSTALIPDRVDDVAQGACFNDARVEVERVVC